MSIVGIIGSYLFRVGKPNPEYSENTPQYKDPIHQASQGNVPIFIDDEMIKYIEQRRIEEREKYNLASKCKDPEKE